MTKNKRFFIVPAVIFFVLAGLVIWYGGMSIAKRIDMVTMRARFDAAQNAQASGHRQMAASAYRLAIMEYQKGLAKPGYYLDIASDYLIAGNCFQRQGQRRAALVAYEKGLRNDPHSVSLLTSAGLCSLRLGEFKQAAAFLSQSREIYPNDKRVNQTLRKLKLQLSGKREQ